MSKKSVTLTVVLFVFLASLPILAACQPSRASAAKAFDSDLAISATVQRWEAMGQAYANKVALVGMDTATARWQAMGQAYEMLARLGARPAADVSTARWEAMGRAFAEFSGPAADVSSARWEAMGQAYEAAGLLGD